MTKIREMAAGPEKKAEITPGASIREVCAELDNINADLDKIARELSAKMEALKAKRAAEIEALQARYKALKDWAEAEVSKNRATLFIDGKKSVKFGRVTLGFRLEKASLVIQKEDVTWEKVLAYLQRKASAFVISEPQIDTKKLIKEARTPDVAKVMKHAGIAVKQGENFYLQHEKTAVE